MGKIQECIKKKQRIFIGIFIGLSLGGIGVVAKTTLKNNEVSYTNASSSVTNVQGAIEELYEKSKFEFQVPNLTENGARYTGLNPNNYVSFNGELWGIIGIFDGKIKIIRNESIGSMAWNSTENNDWASSSLYSYLNGEYYNGINVTYKNMIENATWRTGGWSTASITTAQMYGYEGSTKGASSTSLTATGYIGLMSLSDYGYASSGCYEGAQTLWDYNNSTCTNTNWVKSELNEWTITPDSLDANNAFYVNKNWRVGNRTVASVFEVRLSLYLKSNVYITGGTGTSRDPYTLLID